MKILLLTDIHAGRDRNHAHLKGQDYTNVFGGAFFESVKEIKRIAKECNLIVNLGDFISESSIEKDIEQYQQGISILMRSNVPVLHVAGNHDLVYMNRDNLKKLWKKEKTYYFEDIGGYRNIVLGYRNIVLDGNREGNKNGVVEKNQRYRFDEKQILWLSETLNATDLPVLIYCHFPLDSQDISQNYYWEQSENPDERCFPIGYEKIREIIENSGKVIGVFSGHTHFQNISTIHEIPYYTVGSFGENDGNGKPAKEYGIAFLEGKNISMEFKRL